MFFVYKVKRKFYIFCLLFYKKYIRCVKIGFLFLFFCYIRMKSHKFNLLKNAWLWASIAVMMCVFGIFVFAINMQFSEEFTG